MGDHLYACGRAQPEPEEADLRKWLVEMGLDSGGLAGLNKQTQSCLFSKALASAQSLPTKQDNIFDPSSFPRCQDAYGAFCLQIKLTSADYDLRVTAVGRKHAYVLYRIQLNSMVSRHLADGHPNVYLQGQGVQPDICLILKEFRQMPKGQAILMVQFACVSREKRGVEPQSVRDALEDHLSGCGPQRFEMLNDQSLLLKQVLLENAARLTPEYKQRRMLEWGIVRFAALLSDSLQLPQPGTKRLGPAGSHHCVLVISYQE
ncbi:hypothetical protein WJX73_009067 [Symbiochloris irregularis]|uniref:Uncharacterized protein n=1 Tax=Symbiochloris irregularis TaxID=706552 RepID=A0AAW1PVE7_9CHLO